MNSKFLMSALLVISGFLSQGCSTPAPGSDYSDYEMMRQEAWSAYNSCLDSLGPYGRAGECDDVNPASASTSSPYAPTGYYQTTQVQAPAQYYGYGTPPPYYLYSAEPNEVDAMKEKWLSLADEPREKQQL